MMLKLRRGTVVAVEPLTVEIGAERRRAWADVGLVGPIEVGDEVIVNTEAVDLGLGSGGFDVVHANLTRGLEAPGGSKVHVMKLNYTSLQHPVEPVELAEAPAADSPKPPVLVIPIHGHLAPVAWAASQASPGLRLGFLQGAGAALRRPVARRRRVARARAVVRARDRWCRLRRRARGDHPTGGIDAAARGLDWEAIVVGPGPGILGRDTPRPRRHGGPRRPTPRSPSGSRRSSARGRRAPTSAPAIAGSAITPPRCSSCCWRPCGSSCPRPSSRAGRCSTPRRRRGLGTGGARCSDRDLQRTPRPRGRADRLGYADTGLPASTMGRSISEDPLFFAAPLAAGRALAGARAG